MNKLIQKSLLVLGSAGLAVSLAACSSGSSSDGGGSDSGGDVTLTMWLWPGMGFAEKAKQYEEENPGIKIDIQEAEYADAHQNLITALQQARELLTSLE